MATQETIFDQVNEATASRPPKPITVQEIQSKIINLPGRPPVMLAQDLALLYQVTPAHLSGRVKCNQESFPEDVSFYVTEKERQFLLRQNVVAKKKLRLVPRVFTAQGANMLAAVIKSPVDADRFVQIMRAFTKHENEKHVPPDFDNAIEAAEAWLAARKEVEAQKALLLEAEPKVAYHDEILRTTGVCTVTQIAKDYGLSALRLNKILAVTGVQFKSGGQWVLTHKHAGKGYVASRTYAYAKRDGSVGSSVATLWTQKGRLFIHQLLASLGHHARNSEHPLAG